MKLLFLALSSKGFGETVLGVGLASRLRDAGHQCAFLVHALGERLVKDARFQHSTINDTVAPLLQLYVQMAIDAAKPDVIVLADYFTTSLALSRAKSTVDDLTKSALPVIAIDTWDMSRSGNKVDIFGVRRQKLKDGECLVGHLIPVPIGRLVRDGCHYSCLPESIKLTKKVRRHIRRDLGLSDQCKVVLTCSAAWQQVEFDNAHGRRIASAVPELLGEYVKRLGERVHLVHVGPKKFSLDLHDRYHWLPSLDPAHFQLLVASVDLHLSLNVSATTIGRALVSGVPTICAINSREINDSVDKDEIDESSSPYLKKWITRTKPIFKFRMWPLGYHSFLEPLLAGNEYTRAIVIRELLEEEALLGTLNDLLFDRQKIESRLDKQERYVKCVRELPSPVACVEALADGGETKWRIGANCQT